MCSVSAPYKKVRVRSDTEIQTGAPKYAQKCHTCGENSHQINEIEENSLQQRYACCRQPGRNKDNCWSGKKKTFKIVVTGYARPGYEHINLVCSYKMGESKATSQTCHISQKPVTTGQRNGRPCTAHETDPTATRSGFLQV